MKEHKPMIVILVIAAIMNASAVVKYLTTPPKEVVKTVISCTNQEAARKTVIQEAKDFCHGKWTGKLQSTSDSDFGVDCN